MKFYAFLFALALLSGFAPTQAQTVYSGETTIDKNNVPGLYLTLQGNGKQIEKDWETELKKYGRLSSSRGVYRIPNADIPAVSPEPINLLSTVKSSRNSATIFLSLDKGSGNFVRTGDAGYSEAENILNTFAKTTAYNQEVSAAQGSFDDAQKAHQKLVRDGERLQRAIENNGKEKERLLKRIDDNAKELEQLQKDIEANKTQQVTALTDLNSRKSNVEAVKAKKSN